MKRDDTSILNAELAGAIAAMGHTDVLMIVDAGFPIPDDANRIDLALTRGIPTIEQVLTAVDDELIAERVLYADDVPEMNPPLDRLVNEVYGEGSGTEVDTIPHEDVLAYGSEAKAIVRTGDFNPWGNIVIQCGTDPKAWFADDEVSMPPAYEERYTEMYGEE
ncbi:D-ribose pyranase [Salinigranum salinum]|uniref:D-ribose pyranase n=1 Tax=Salinigranum salinum TaxID=1364937 RepID=UPI00126059F5|nr:D-ribose pyranase [Salinigranum salinum]